MVIKNICGRHTFFFLIDVEFKSVSWWTSQNNCQEWYICEKESNLPQMFYENNQLLNRVPLQVCGSNNVISLP